MKDGKVIGRIDASLISSRSDAACGQQFQILDFLQEDTDRHFDFIYAVAVIHMLVAATSCRMVSFDSFETEIKRNDLAILETGITAAPPEFDQLMYAVVRA